MVKTIPYTVHQQNTNGKETVNCKGICGVWGDGGTVFCPCEFKGNGGMVKTIPYMGCGQKVKGSGIIRCNGICGGVGGWWNGVLSLRI